MKFELHYFNYILMGILIVAVAFGVILVGYDPHYAPSCEMTITIWSKPDSILNPQVYITTDGCRLYMHTDYDVQYCFDRKIDGTTTWGSQGIPQKTFNVTVRNGIFVDSIVGVEGCNPYEPPIPPDRKNCRLCGE